MASFANAYENRRIIEDYLPRADPVGGGLYLSDISEGEKDKKMKYRITFEFVTERELADQEKDTLVGFMIKEIQEPWTEEYETGTWDGREVNYTIEQVSA